MLQSLIRQRAFSNAITIQATKAAPSSYDLRFFVGATGTRWLCKSSLRQIARLQYEQLWRLRLSHFYSARMLSWSSYSSPLHFNSAPLHSTPCYPTLRHSRLLHSSTLRPLHSFLSTPFAPLRTTPLLSSPLRPNPFHSFIISVCYLLSS